MSRESCIAHPPKQLLAIIRQDYYELTGRDACAAALLNIFEYWANAALANDPTVERPWVGPRPIREFEQRLLGIATDKQIRKRLAQLEERGFIQTQRPARRGAAKGYRVMVPEIQQALVGHLTHEGAAGRPDSAGHLTGEGQGLQSFDQSAVGCLTDRPVVKQPIKLRSNDRALKKDLKELKENRKERKKEERAERTFSALSAKHDLPSPAKTPPAEGSEPILVGTVTYSQPPEKIDYAELWETDPGLAKSRLRQIAPGHKRPEMVAHGLGHWWVGPGLNDFDPALIKACQNRKRKFQQSDSPGDAKTYLNNMLRNGDWGNLTLRCDEAVALRERAAELPLARAAAKPGITSRSPFERSAQERRASALGLACFKLSQGLTQQALALAQQFGLSMAELGLADDPPGDRLMPHAA